MKTRLTWVMGMVLVVSVAATSALAATPKPAAVYTGSGKDFMNNAPKWTDEGTGRISFSTSGKDATILHFKGSFSYYCGAGRSTVTEKSMRVTKGGKFGTEFSQPNKEPDGKVNGKAYVAISGTFENGGKQAKVSYLVDFVFSGGRVKDPYSTSNPRALGCASWVRGTVRTK